MKDWYYNIKYFLLNIWFHRKSLWKSRPWDYSGIYLVMRDNIHYLQTSCQKHSLHVNKDRDVKEMEIVLRLLDRLIEDDYSKQHTNPVNMKRDWLNWKFEPTYFLPKGSFMRLYKLEDSLRKQDEELLFKILKTKSRHWWF